MVSRFIRDECRLRRGKGACTTLPQGLKINRLHTFSVLPVQFSGSYENNFADQQVAPEWFVSLIAKFLFPI